MRSGLAGLAALLLAGCAGGTTDRPDAVTTGVVLGDGGVRPVVGISSGRTRAVIAP